MGCDVGRELADRLAAWALCAVHIERQADRQSLDFVFPRQLGKGGQIGCEPGAPERRERRGEHAERVGCGDADGLAADIERHQSSVAHQQRLQTGKIDDRH